MAPAAAPADPERVASIMLSWHSLDLVSLSKVQTLWAGYGFICAVTASATTPEAASRLDSLCGVQPGTDRGTYRLILKLISPPHTSASEPEDEGYLRKMLSYEVEQYFYSRVAPRLSDDEAAVAKCLATTLDMDDKPGSAELQGLIATIMADLRPRFPVAGEKRSLLNPKQAHAALDWLARFHRSSWQWLPRDLDGCVRPPLAEASRRKDGALDECRPGNGLWLYGGYTYLATRRKEYAQLAQDVTSEWRAALCMPWQRSLSPIADMVADFLAPRGRPFETCIHGDVKSENLFTTTEGDAVAFFDFQYVGLGLGVCDLAKFFTSSVPLGMLTDVALGSLPAELPMGRGEQQLLERYRNVLLRGGRESGDSYPWNAFVRHWETALVDWLRFQASWGFWGNTEWLEARVRSIRRDQGWTEWLQRTLDSETGINGFS